jgi:hypothetical protein
MFVAVVTVVCTALAVVLGFVLSKLAINVIHNMWFSSMESKDKLDLQQLSSYCGTVAAGLGVLIACLVEHGDIFPVVKVFFWVMLSWQAFLWGISLFLVVSFWLGRVIDRLTGARS